MKRASLTVAVALLLGSGAAKAEPDDRPTLSVLAFAAGQGLLSPVEAAELADDLAGRLVETGRFRVLPREWLAPAAGGPSALTALRQAARLAGVRYLVAASVTDLSGRPSPQAPRALSGPARAILALGAARRGRVPCAATRSQASIALVEVRVIDALTGAVGRTSLLRVRLGIPPPTAIPGCGGGAPAPLAAFVAAKARPVLDSLKSANQDVADGLVIPEDPRHSVTP